MKKLISVALIALGLTFLSGCSFARIKPGHSLATLDGVTANAVQSQDPKEPMTQNITTSSTDERVIPAGSTVEVTAPGSTNATKVTLSQPMPVKYTSAKTVETKVGASQKNTAAELAAKLASMRWIQWLGILIVLFGIASLAYPPIRLVINSVTTSAWLIGAGAALIFLPLVIVGHEILIIAICVGGAALWFFAHRHGGVTAELATLKAYFVPAKPAVSPAPAAAGNISAAPLANA